MSAPAPKIDTRTAVTITNQIQDLLELYTADPVSGEPRWQERFNPLTREPKSGSAALIGIFARYAELIIQRLNQVPDKNFLAFLDLLGASLLPPQPARAPLTFSLAAGSIADAVVPQGTQVAAPPMEGEEAPVIFETEQELVVTAVQLSSLFVRDPRQDMTADCSAITTPEGATAVPLFRGSHQLEHILYLGHERLLGFPEIETLELAFELSPPLGDGGLLAWEQWNGDQWKPCPTPMEAVSNPNLSQETSTVTFANMDAIPIGQVNDTRNRWLRCRLLTPITPVAEQKANMVRAAQLPIITGIVMTAAVKRFKLAIDTAFSNALAVDLSKDFFPFGEQPKFGDAFYLAHSEAFAAFPELANAGDTDRTYAIMLNVTLTDSVALPRPQETSITAELAWEFWNGKQWRLIGTSTPDRSKPNSDFSNTFNDPTKAFTIDAGDQPITFTLPEQPQVQTVNGVTGYWLRVRVVAGNYGQAAGYRRAPDRLLFNIEPNLLDDLNLGLVSGRLSEAFQGRGRITLSKHAFVKQEEPDRSWEIIDPVIELTYAVKNEFDVLKVYFRGEGFVLEPADFAPPSIKALTAGYELTESDRPQKLVAYNDFRYTLQEIETQTPFAPFQRMRDDRPTLYYGFALPPGRIAFPNNTLSLFNRIADFKYGEKTIPLSPLHSLKTAVTGTETRHTFTVTNPTADVVTYQLNFLGTMWSTAVSTHSMSLGPGASEDVDLFVTPVDAAIGDSDQGFLWLWQPDKPAHKYNATFTTVVGATIPVTERLQLAWQYWNGRKWAQLTVQDDSENLTRSDLAQFLAPADIIAHKQFGLTRYWLRVCWQAGDYKIEPRLQHALLNTVMAAQTVTIRNEIIGSSDGSEKQSFRANRFPVLSNPQLDVRESEQPSAEEQKVIFKEEGQQAIVSTGDAHVVWVRWHEVIDFYASGPRDRHYVLNHLTGEVTFGDGLNGMIPPLANGNLRLTYYQTGGGISGNKAANTVIQLKTTVPYVDKVTNTEAASGGSSAESLDNLRRRMPRTVRHRARAVTLEDYEDLAMLASPAVARARCVPLYDLESDPDATLPRPGTVSLIIVPQASEAKPSSSLELLSRVQTYVGARGLPDVTLVVVGPEYVRVDVGAEIALISLQGTSKVKAAVSQVLERFLHPLTGGLDGNGWGFGRQPHKSDLYALLEAVPGVDHIRRLEVASLEDRPRVLATGRFLVYSGTHTIDLVYKD